MPPDEILFRRKDAPERYEEDDFYWADGHLSDEQALPDSDLLKQIHLYASEFYSRILLDEGQGEVGSMDGTALLAMGILLEEAVKQSLGQAGDMVFVEDEIEDETREYGSELIRELSASPRVKIRDATSRTMTPESSRVRKRRKIRHEDNLRGE